MSWGGGSACPGPVLQGVGNGHIKSSIAAACPVGDEHISRPEVGARDQSTAFFCGGKASCSCSLVQGITQEIVPRNSITPKIGFGFEEKAASSFGFGFEE